MVQPMYMQSSMMPRNQQPAVTRPGTYTPPWMFGQGYGGAPPQMQLQSQIAPPAPGAFAVAPPGPSSATVAGVIGQNSEQLIRMAAERRDREAREEQRRQAEEAQADRDAVGAGSAIGTTIGAAASIANPALAPVIMPLANLAGTTGAKLLTGQNIEAQTVVPQLASAAVGASSANKAMQGLASEEAYNNWVLGLKDSDLNSWVNMPSHVAKQMQSSGNFSLFDIYKKGAG